MKQLKSNHLKFQLSLRAGVLAGLLAAAALSRLVPHPANFAPIGAMALFGAAYYRRRLWAFAIPVAAMWLSDLLLNNVVYAAFFDRFIWFYDGAFFTYGAFILIAIVGRMLLTGIAIPNLLAAAVSASALFFVVSNLGVWWSSGMYPLTAAGLQACYAAGLPFLGNTLAGDCFYTALLFGLFELTVRRFPALNVRRA
ncbi:MAG: hypothetical protein LBF90_03435 [Prevotellaceae bacterium]|jgi:hypothetical protein|nr:hypothetical protein [Prevotellaceae bacterium]